MSLDFGGSLTLSASDYVDAAEEAEEASAGVAGASEEMEGSLGDAADSATTTADELEGTGEGAASAQDGLADASAEAIDASDALERTSASADEASESLLDVNKSGLAAGAGIGAAATASQKALDGTRTMREELDRAAITVGMTSDEMQDLATDLSDATFPLEDVTEVTTALAEAGVETEERMRDLAPQIDSLADATGASASEAADLASTIRAMDGDFAALEEDADAFVAAANETQVSLSDVQRTMERLDFQEMEEMGVAADDAAALIAKFGDETGFSGRQLRTNFNQAIDETDGDMEDLIQNLGLSVDEFEEFQQETASGTDLLNEYEQVAADNASTMDDLRSVLGDTTLQFADYVQPASAAIPALQGAASAAVLMSTVNFSALAPSFGAVSLAALPISAVVLAIAAAFAAAVAAGLLIAKFFGDDLRAAAETAQEKLGDFVDFIRGIPDRFRDLVDAGRERFNELVDVITGVPGRVVGTGEEMVAELLDPIPTLSDMMERGEEIVDGLTDGIKSVAGKPAEAIEDVTESVRERLPFSPAREGPLDDIDETGPSLIQTIAGGVTGESGALLEAVESAVSPLGQTRERGTPSTTQAGGRDGLSADAIRRAIDGATLLLEGDDGETQEATVQTDGTRQTREARRLGRRNPNI